MLNFRSGKSSIIWRKLQIKHGCLKLKLAYKSRLFLKLDYFNILRQYMRFGYSTMSLSQMDDLQEIANWDRHECEEKWAETLPKVVEKLTDSSSSASDEKLVAIQILCNQFLPCLKLKDAEKTLFSKFCSEIETVFQDCLILIDDCLLMNQNAEDRDQEFVCEHVNQSLRRMFSLLECVENCLKYVIACDQSITIHDISSLPSCVVDLIDKTYLHCKESSQTYKDYDLEMFSEILSMLFKKSHAVQICFLSLMDKLQTPESFSERSVHILNTVCTGLFRICRTVTSLDVKLIVSLWKSISRLLVQYIQFLGDIVNVTEMVVYLCQEIQSGYQYLLQQMPDQPDTEWNQSDEKGFQKSVKILGFQIKILIGLCKEYLNYLDENKTDKEVYNILIFIHKNSPQWIEKKIGDVHSDEINRQVVISCEPLLTIFIERAVFRDCLLGPLNIPDENNFAHLLMLISITKSFSKMSEESQDAWMGITKMYEKTHEGIIESIFWLISKCFMELSDTMYRLPGIMCSGSAQRLVSLYEFLATHICGFIGSLLNQYFTILEATLLKNLFSKNPFVQLMSIDCWCFMDRFGSSDLCRFHVEFFLEIFENFLDYQPVAFENNSVIILIQRLFSFLEPNDQMSLMLKFSKPVNLKFWCICPFNIDSLQPQHKNIFREVVFACVSKVEEWVKLSNKTAASISTVSQALGALKNLFRNGLVQDLNDQIKDLAERISTMWTFLTTNEWEDNLETESLLVLMIQALPFIQMYFSDQILVEVFMLLKEIVATPNSRLFVIEVIKFIRRCSPVYFASPQIPVLIQDIVFMISTNHNSLINHVTLEAITDFAEQTPHCEIIPNCLKENKNLELKLVEFANKTISREPNVRNFLKLQEGKLNNDAILSWNEELNDEKSSSNNTLPFKPPLKRARLDSEESSYEMLLSNLQSDWSMFENLANRNPIPDWFKTSVKILMDKFYKKAC